MTRNEYAYPYDVLTHWLLEEIELEVEVKACRQLVFTIKSASSAP